MAAHTAGKSRRRYGIRWSSLLRPRSNRDLRRFCRLVGRMTSAVTSWAANAYLPRRWLTGLPASSRLFSRSYHNNERRWKGGIYSENKIIGWGSLVSSPRELATAGPFEPSGPELPIEFLRVSGDGRLTLVIDERYGSICSTYSADSSFASLPDAMENLRRREGMRSLKAVGFVNGEQNAESPTARRRHLKTLRVVREWLKSSGGDAVIWTALESNFETCTKRQFSTDTAIWYLESLEPEDLNRALDYIRSAPQEVRTPLRGKAAQKWPKAVSQSDCRSDCAV